MPSSGAAGALLCLLVCTLSPEGASAQAAATLPLSDPAYGALARLEAMGLAAPLQRAGPLSVGRARALAGEARARLAALPDVSDPTRADAEALLETLERTDGDAPARLLVEVEAGAGRSPGRAVPDNGLGGLDAVLNPLWSGLGGRTYGDRWSVSSAAHAAAGLGECLAMGLGVRHEEGGASGALPGRGGTSLEALSLRAVLGRFAVQVGRERVWAEAAAAGAGERYALALGPDAPPLDQLRVSTERPARIPVLGEVDASLFVADLGAGHVFPHAKLFGVLASARPAAGLELGLVLLNKQLGEGAPDASRGERLKDLLWIRPNPSDEPGFSNKTALLRARARTRGLVLVGEAALADFDRTRLSHTFRSSASYRVALTLPALGEAGRHALAAEASTVGPYAQRHHQYLSGGTVDGHLLGSPLGPEASAVALRWARHAPARGWRVGAGLALERRGGDVWEPSPAVPGGRPTVREARPDETRVRLEGELARTLRGGRAGVGIRLGAERVRAFGHAPGDDRTLGAALVRFWRSF